MAKKKTKDPEKKAALQAKKAAKADKAERKRLQKESSKNDDADTLDDLLEAYKRQDQEQIVSTTLETIDGFPLPRANATLTLADSEHSKHAYLFGGEIYDGVEQIVLDELLRWDIVKNEWKRITTPSASRPAPRCAHSTVYYNNALFVFGGELASADQYHHYKDLWKLDLSTLTWEELKCSSSSSCSPSARSGHAAFVWKHYMVVFGGFYEALRDTRWFNDLYVLDLQSLVWIDIEQHSLKFATRPEPRSAVNVGLYYTHTNDTVLIHGGFSKLPKSTAAPETMGKETKVHRDAWWLHLKPLLQNKPPTWERLSSRVLKSAFYSNNSCIRSGTASCTYKHYMLIFGGVQDTEQHHHILDSVFYNDLVAFDMERRKWYPIRVVNNNGNDKSSMRRRRKQREKEEELKQNEAQQDSKEEQESSDSDLEEDEDENVAVDSSSAGWDLNKLRSNMNAFIDGDGNLVYEKIDQPGVKQDEMKIQEEEGDEEKDVEKEEEKQDGGRESTEQIVAMPFKKNLPAVSSSAVMSLNESTGTPEPVAQNEPLPRINAALFVRSNVLYVYGGLLEVGDREVTLDDCWSFDLRKRDKWECLWKGTMHKQVWRGATVDDDDSYISTEQGGDDDSGEESASEDELDPEEKAAKKSSKKDKSKHAVLRQEIAELKEQLEAEDSNKTPQMGEAMADFYSRIADYWNTQGQKLSTTNDSDKPTSKEMKREGFNLARTRYDELSPILDRLNELTSEQQQESDEARKERKAEKTKKESRRTNRRSR